MFLDIKIVCKKAHACNVWHRAESKRQTAVLYIQSGQQPFVSPAIVVVDGGDGNNSDDDKWATEEKKNWHPAWASAHARSLSHLQSLTTATSTTKRVQRTTEKKLYFSLSLSVLLVRVRVCVWLSMNRINVYFGRDTGYVWLCQKKKQQQKINEKKIRFVVLIKT